MSIPEQFPEDRGDGVPATPQGVAGLLAGIMLPLIEPFDGDSPALAGLPDYPPVPALVPEPASRNAVAYQVQCAGIDALEQLRIHQAKVDACRVRAVAQVRGAAEVQWRAAKLDNFQRSVSGASVVAELALALCIPERTAASLEHRACELVNDYPAVLAGMEAGTFGYGHAVVMLNESHTLETTAGATSELLAAFLAKLLTLVVGTTVSAFKGKARRARERMCPESLDTRTKEAWARRSMNCETGANGMSWLTLHLPTMSATAIYTYCTRLARALKYDAATSDRLNKNRNPGTTEDLREHRTLDQLRTDIATLLLLNQNPTTWDGTSGTSERGGRGGSTTSGADKTGGWTRPATNTGSRHDGSTEGSADGGARHEDDSAAPSGDGHGTLVPATTGTAMAAGAAMEDQDDDESPWANHDPVPPPHTPPENPNNLDGPDNPGGPDSREDRQDRQDREEWEDPGGGSGVLEGVILPEGLSFMAGQDFFEDVLGDGSGWDNGLVDGIREDSWAEYQHQLQQLQNAPAMTAPPLPQGLFILTVPILSLFGLTNEPAEIAGTQGGLLPASIARELTARAPSLLRILTDPVTGDALPLHPQRYTLTKTEKTALRALKGGCYMPNCPNPVMETDLDHLRAFEFGGASTIANLAPACEAHHRLRHLKDDKDKNGQRRAINEPERHTITLRGWTPQTTPDGRVGWTTPTGRYQPPTPNDPARPEYPHWLQQLITQTTKTQRT